MSDELKMCPFCGGNAESYSVTSVADFDDDKTLQKKFCVDCSNCDCNLTWFETEKEAVEAWNNRAESRELADLKAQNEALHVTISSMGETVNGLLDECLELEAHNAMLMEALEFYTNPSNVSCSLLSTTGVAVYEVITSIHRDVSGEEPYGYTAKKALSTTPSEALEKQRKKDEIFNMLLEACEETLSENLHLTDGDDCTLFTLREATEKAKELKGA